MQRKNGPMLIHIPHASAWIPVTERSRFCISDLNAELLNMTDLYTDELFGGTYDAIRFPVSRLVCDPERFRDDNDEDMSRVGMGAVYTRTSCGEVLRKVNARERESILCRYYDPHHRSFTALVSQKLRTHGRCLIIDAHSFPAIPLPYEPDQDKNRPDFCIGADPFHTPPGLRNACESVLRDSGYSVSVNRPFSGAIVPISFYKTDRRVQSVMIEVNRKLYMEPDGSRKKSFGDVRRILQDLLHALDLRYTETDR